VSAGAANRFSLRRRREVARRVKEFPEPVRPSKYPWGDWLDGQIWELKSGEDFDGKPTNFRSVALAQARNRGGRVKTHLQKQEDGSARMYLQFIRDETST
jgi:hypothetical protein